MSRSLPNQALGLALLLLAACAPVYSQASAQDQAVLDRAHAMHQRLEQRPVSERHPADYTAITDLLATVWRRQPRVDPTQDARATPAEEALFDAGGVSISLATALHDAKAWSAAAADYALLLHRYPSTLYRRNAEWALAEIDWYHRAERGEARSYLRDFLRRYPADARALIARRQLRGERVAEPPALLPSGRDTGEFRAPELAPADNHVEAVAAVAQNAGAPQAAGPPAPVKVDGLRWATTADSLSVIVDLSGQPSFERGVVPETHTVYFDLHDAHFGRLMDNRSVDLSNDWVRRIMIAQNRTGVIRLVINEVPGGKISDAAMFFPNPARLVIAIHPAAPVTAVGPPSRLPVTEARASAPPLPPTHRSAEPRVTPARTKPASLPASLGSEPSATATADAASTVLEAQPLPDGNRSLTRALGLKIGRIVLDAGHGGHDTGTIGSNALNEKDVVLDVVLRLGRLLHRRLGADVIYTRRDDTFIPLQERTAIANRAHADLFVSVHANSSPDHNASGIETYYLNLTHNPQALDVAARENAAGQLGEHELQNLLQTITLNDKRLESRALCQSLETSLTHGLNEDNRGVRSAPFIVLIGAQMPSVLAEISFLSNAHDARLLAKSSYRERIAEALYRGIARYIASLGGVQAEIARQSSQKTLSEAAVAPSANLTLARQ